jgi:hypothetical protein
MNLVRKNIFVDLEAPMYMAEWQLEKFKEFMNNEFGSEVEFVDVIEPEREWSDRDSDPNVRFSFDELVIMLQPGSMNEKIHKLLEYYPKRGRWTIELKMGVIVPKFNKFLKEKGISKITKEIIKQFLTETGLL